MGAWREAFLRAPYVRATFVAMGVLSETFETAVTWDRFPAFHERVTGGRASGRRRRAPGRLGSPAASPMSTPTARPPTSR